MVIQIWWKLHCFSHPNPPIDFYQIWHVVGYLCCLGMSNYLGRKDDKDLNYKPNRFHKIGSRKDQQSCIRKTWLDYILVDSLQTYHLGICDRYHPKMPHIIIFAFRWFRSMQVLYLAYKEYNCFTTLQWRYNGREGFSNPRRFDCLQLFVQAQINDNIKAPRHLPLWGEFTGDRWIPRIKAQ